MCIDKPAANMKCLVSYSYEHQAMDRKWVMDAITAQQWGRNRKRIDVEHSLSNSSVCGAFSEFGQIGIIRAVTDQRFFGYIGDLVVDKAYRERGIGTQLVRLLLRHPDCAGVSNWMTTTQSASAFFERMGFKQVNPKTNLVAKGHPIGVRLQIDE